MHCDVLIVGGGHAGAHAAIALRQHKFDGTIAIVGDEPDLPYERPPLSKEYLAGEKTFERILIRAPAFWDDRAVTMLTGRRVTQVDPAAHRVATECGEEIGYGSLIWATGGRPRRLTCEGHDLAGVHAIRTRADVDRLRAELPAARRAVVIGGGYIGLEGASALVKQGKHVVLVEALDRVLARVAGPALSRFYEGEHRAHGVDLRLDSAVDRLLGTEGRVTAVRLADGEEIACDLVIVGIGVLPAIEPLVAAGANAGNGVAVDAQCRTTLPDIFAIGDCALHENAFADGAAIRLESVQNANDMATIAAKALTGQGEAYRALPWFWSNQYDLKLQTAGLSSGHDEALVRGDPATRSFSIIYRKTGRVIALDCVNALRDYVQGRALVADRARIEASILTDAAIPLKDAQCQA